jgi:hypothetical protein
MCTCCDIMVLIRGVGWNMASYGDGEAPHSLCSCGVCAEPYRYCGWDVRNCSCHIDPCVLSFVDFRALASVFHTLEFRRAHGYSGLD